MPAAPVIAAVVSAAVAVGGTVYSAQQQRKADSRAQAVAAQQQREADRVAAEQSALLEERNRLEALSIKNQEKSLEQERLAQEEQRARDRKIEQRQRRSEIRANRAQRAELENTTGQTGSSQTSGAIGGATSLSAQLNSSLGFGGQISNFNDNISAYLQSGAAFQGRAIRASGQAQNAAGRAQQVGLVGDNNIRRIGVAGAGGIAKARRGVSLGGAIAGFGQQVFSTTSPYAFGQ